MTIVMYSVGPDPRKRGKDRMRIHNSTLLYHVETWPQATPRWLKKSVVWEEHGIKVVGVYRYGRRPSRILST